MTDDELRGYFTNHPLPTGHVKFSHYESTDDLANMVALALERIRENWPGAVTSKAALMRVVAWLEGHHGTGAKEPHQ